MRSLLGPALALLLAACSSDRTAPGPAGSGGAHVGGAGGAGAAGAGGPVKDGDGDGYAASDDCDDGDAAVHPGAQEICNGLDDDCDGTADDGVPNDGSGCQDPGPPAFGEVVDTIVVSIRTGDGVNDGTNANKLTLCVSASDCFLLDVADVNDRRVGELDVYHFEGLALPRSKIDRVQIRSQNGTDRWVPACMEIQLDGQQVYCNPDLAGLKFGNEVGEIQDWSDPQGLHVGCTTCFASPLTHGPMVGAVGPNDARLWLRTHATVGAKLRLSPSDVLDEVAPVALAYPEARADYAHTFWIHGLAPATVYYYDVEVEGERTAPRSFRTAPPLDEPTGLRFAFGSCTRHDAQPIFERIDALAPDLFLFVGDNHYGNTADLSSLRWYYRWGFERKGRAALLERTPTIAVWDDHDYVGNNTTGSALGKDVALRAFTEYWANPSFGTADATGVFFRYRWGDVDFFMLDDRYYRGLEGSVLGSAQTAWLEQELKASTATFKLLVSGSQFTQYGSSDSWAAFPAATTALFDFLRDEKIEGVVLLSGDIHRSSFRLIDRGAAGAYDLPELTSSPLANTNSKCKSDGELKSCFDDDDFFVVVDVDSGATPPTLEARIVDVAGVERDGWTILLSELQL